MTGNIYQHLYEFIYTLNRLIFSTHPVPEAPGKKKLGVPDIGEKVTLHLP